MTYKKGNRVMVLMADVEGIHWGVPRFSGPGVIDLIGEDRAKEGFGVLMVPELLPEPYRSRNLKIGQWVYPKYLQPVPDGVLLTYPDLGLKWTENGIEALE